jgi:hypothetical protein
MSSIRNTIRAMEHGHQCGVPAAGWNHRQLFRTKLTGNEFANVFIGFRMLRKPAPISFDSLFDIMERWSD